MTLTPAEIEAMPAGDEMNKLISDLVMGEPVEWRTAFRTSNGYFSSTKPQDVIKKPDGAFAFVPDYSGSHAPVWEMEQKIFDDGLAVGYIANLIYIVNRENDLRVVGDWVQYFYMAHATPLQKCRAALMTAMKDEK